MYFIMHSLIGPEYTFVIFHYANHFRGFKKFLLKLSSCQNSLVLLSRDVVGDKHLEKPVFSLFDLI